MLVTRKSDLYFLQEAAKVATKSLCSNRYCGSVIVKSGKIIGRGYNGPPLNDVTQRRCHIPINRFAKYPTDKTCCVHAEWRAIMDAVKKHPKQINGATLYFVSINKGGEWEFSRKPYCTVCSKLTLDSGIKQTVLWFRKGVRAYESTNYNDLSYTYRKRGPSVYPDRG
ncbi:hypothetical protein HY346_02485 [Candidatus Microgenomates bacterium]|nr:hypothetical protein [Candidatus Microgenomates bacterium]